MKRKFHEGREAGMNVTCTIRDSHGGRDAEKHPIGRKAFYTRRRARRAGILATLATLMSMLVASMGAASAQADGVGSASARGTLTAFVGTTTPFFTTAEFSAVSPCDETQSRPFIVRIPNGVFTKSGVNSSGCLSDQGRNTNFGSGVGTWSLSHNMAGTANFTWNFQDGESPSGSDSVNISIEGTATAAPVNIVGIPAPLNGTPGGVWVFGSLPWPFALSGAEVSPGLGDPDGTGSASLQLDPAQGRVCWEIHVSNITLPTFAAHIHAAPVGMSGLIVVTLSPPDSSGVSVGCTEGVDSALIEDMISSPEQFYLDVHTPDRPAGAVRGQLG